jgi:hypothetical protein
MIEVPKGCVPEAPLRYSTGCLVYTALNDALIRGDIEFG